MKEKDFIKLSLLDKTIDHDKIKNNILSKTEKPVHTRRQPFKPLAVTACLLLLTVSVVAVPLMLNNADEPILPANTENSTVAQEENAVAQEESTEVSSMDVSSDTELNRKIVYGNIPFQPEQTSPSVVIYGELQIDGYLERAMDAPENKDALFKVFFNYCSDEVYNNPKDVELIKAKNKYLSSGMECSRIRTEFDNYYKFYILDKIDFSTIPEDIHQQLSDEYNTEDTRIIRMKNQYGTGLLMLNNEFNYKIKSIEAAKVDDQTRTEILNQIHMYKAQLKEALEKFSEVDEYFHQMQSKVIHDLIDEVLVRNNINPKEIHDKYGELLLTKEQILSIKIEEDEEMVIYLAHKISEFDTEYQIESIY